MQTVYVKQITNGTSLMLQFGVRANVDYNILMLRANVKLVTLLFQAAANVKEKRNKTLIRHIYILVNTMNSLISCLT